MPDAYSRLATKQKVPRTGGVAAPVLAALFCALGGALAQTSPAVKESTVYNRPVLLVSNHKLEVAVVKQGGSLLRILIRAILTD